MFTDAVLFDVRVNRQLVSRHFVQEPPSAEFIDMVIESYYALFQSGQVETCHPVIIEDRGVLICPLNEFTVLIVVGSNETISKENLEAATKLHETLAGHLKKSSLRNVRRQFSEIVDQHLSFDVVVRYFSNENDVADSPTIKAIASADRRCTPTESGPKSYVIGPYKVKIENIRLDSFSDWRWESDCADVDVFSIIFSERSSVESLSTLIHEIRGHSGSSVLVIPSSEAGLESARRIEDEFGLLLCDAVSEEPTEVLLSTLAVSGYLDIHPELAKSKLVITEPLFRKEDIVDLELDVDVKHQAFFVVDRNTANPLFSFFYEKDNSLLQRAPGLITAVSLFELDEKGTSTSVFETGEYNYVVIERDKTIFALITGRLEDAEEIREKFAFLPDLWIDEAPEDVIETIDLYQSPPFTIKLLATLPPEKFSGRMAPYHVEEPEWERFTSSEVKDFLQAVWTSLDGRMRMSQLVTSSGPEMVLGAIHLLKLLGAINMKLVLFGDDIPVLLEDPDEDTLTLYRDLPVILDKVDGKLTIDDISKNLQIDTPILLTVFTELHSRGIIEFKD